MEGCQEESKLWTRAETKSKNLLPFHMYTSVDAYDSTDEQALTSIQELFKAVSSEKEADTPVHPSGTNFKSDVEPVALPGEDAKCKKSDLICEIGEDSVRLFNGRLELLEKRFYQILSDCRGECDLQKNETEENQECYLDSEEEEAPTKLWSMK
ncbi:hypothetical protein AWC38_SpisGene8706, partial [Stylophora pistillata]